MSTSLEKFVYPLKEKLRFEFDDIESLGDGSRFGNTVKIGQTDWCLEVSNECSDRTDNEKYLGVYLRCLYDFGSDDLGQDELIWLNFTWRLLNQSNSGSDCIMKKSENIYEPNKQSLGYPKFIKWTSLMSDGYVKNGKIILECEVNILSGSISKHSINFEQPRPNNKDLKIMLSKDEYKIERKVIEEEFELSQISTNRVFSHIVYCDGVPCKIGISKYQFESKDWMDVYLYCNLDDESEWWRVEATAEFRIKNRNVVEKFLSKSRDPYLFEKNDYDDGHYLIKWRDLIDPKNGYVKYGRIIVETFVYIRNNYGFDEETGKGIDKPMRKMTDAVISINWKPFQIARMILSHQSTWFCDLFSEHPDKTEYVLPDVDEDLFDKFLHLAHNCKVNVDEDNIEKMLELLDKYRADECIRRLDFQIEDMNVTDDMRMLKLIDKYELPNMKARFVKKLQNINALRKVFRDPDGFKLSDQLRKQLTLDEFTVPEHENDQYYIYSKHNYKTQKVNEPREKIHKFFMENEEAKKLLDDPELQNVGNNLLSLLAKSDESKSGLQFTFKEFSDPSDMMMFNFEDGKCFYSSKQILAHASRYFMKRFFGPDAKDDDNTIIFDEIPSTDFNLLLNHIYHPTKSITEENLDILLPLAHRYGVMDLLEKCENYLIKTETLPVDKKTEYARQYNLEYLSSACSNYLDKR